MRKTMLRASAVLSIVIITAVIGTSPSEATCVAADVIVHRTNQPEQPVFTDGQCLVWTPFGGLLNTTASVSVGNTVTGVPSGAFVDLWVPFP